MYNCNKCGRCCENIAENELYSDLDDGKGVCRYFDKQSRLCAIYDKRPLKCRIDEAYNLWFKSIMTIEEYYNKNYLACSKLKGSD